MSTRSPTTTPPASRTALKSTPKSLRLSSPIAVNPARVPPKGSGPKPPSMSRSEVGFLMDFRVSSPSSLTVAAHTGRPEHHPFVRVDLEEVGRAEDNSPSRVGCHRRVVERLGLLRGSHHDDDCP